MANIFEYAPIEWETLEPRFTLRECLQQIFGYDFIGNDVSSSAYVNYHEDGFYDASIRAYLPTLSKWILRHCRLKGIQLSQEQEDYIKDISMQEPLPEEWDTIREVRLALIATYNFIQPNASKKAEDIALFFEDMVVIWDADGVDLMGNNPLPNSVSTIEVEELNQMLLQAFSQAENPRVRERAMQIIASWKKLW